MSINLSIKNASDEVVAALKLRAQQNHRSLQGELMAIIEAAAANWLAESGGRGFQETAAGWPAKDQGVTARQAREQRLERSDVETGDTESERRERDIQHLMGLLERGLPLGDRRFTRDEMHER